jgi:cobalamin biosynthesis protein CbiD
MMLVKIAKGACFRFKKLSDFRLEIYKLYASRTGASKPIVEKAVESVEFHSQNGL